MAREADFAGIRQILQPLEDSGTLIRRTDEDVCYLHILVCSNFSLSNAFTLQIYNEAPLPPTLLICD